MKKFCKIFLSTALSLLIAFSFAPQLAFSEVRTSDVIVTDSVESRGIKATDCPNIFASNAILKTADGKVLFSRDADSEVKIASLTKIMTAIVALDNSTQDTVISVSANAVATGGSSAGLVAGDSMTMSEALYALMVPSGNDAATAIAESLGQKIAGTTDTSLAYDSFVSKMNEKAQDLGCTHTKFTNPHGLDDGNFESDSHSSAADLMLMIEYAMKNTTFSSVVKTPSHDLKITRNGQTVTSTLTSTDSLLESFEGASGIKTGTTDLAGYCFAGACERNSQMVYSVVLGSTDDATRFQDTKTLFNWYFDNLVDYKLLNAEDNIAAYVTNTSWTDVTIPATFKNESATCRVFKFDGNVSQSFEFYDVSGDVKQGDTLGKVNFIQNNKVIDTEDLIAAQDCAGPDVLQTIGVGFQRFVNLLTGGQSQSDSVVMNDTPLVLKF